VSAVRDWLLRSSAGRLIPAILETRHHYGGEPSGSSSYNAVPMLVLLSKTTGAAGAKYRERQSRQPSMFGRRTASGVFCRRHNGQPERD